MLSEVNEGESYLSGSGIKFIVLHLAKHAQDCSIPMVVFSNLEPTKDYGVGSIWVISQAVKPRHLWRGYKVALACEPVLRNTAVYISSVITQSRQL